MDEIINELSEEELEILSEALEESSDE